MPDLDLKGVDTPPEPTTLELLRDAEEIPLDARLAPRKEELKKSERKAIAEMVGDDFDRDWKAWAEWRETRADIIERFIMKPVPKTEPWEGAANLRLPTMMIATFPTQARMMASVFGNDPAVKIKGVNATGRENKVQAESLMHWDARVKNGGDYELLERTSNSVAMEGGRPIYTFWDQDIRFVQDIVDVYISELTGEVILDNEGEPLLFPDMAPIVPLQDGTNAILKRKVIESERIVYDAPRSIDLDPEDFLVPYDAKGIQYPDAAHCMIIEREHFNRIKYKARHGTYYLTKKELSDIISYVKEKRPTSEEQISRHTQILQEREGVQETEASREAEKEIRLIRWFGRHDLNGDGIDEECIFLVHKETSTLVWWAYLDDVVTHGKRPIAYPFYRRIPGRFAPIGLGHILQHIDDAVNALFNIAMDWGKIQNVPYFFYVSGTLEDEEIRLKPGRGVAIAPGSTPIFPSRTGSIDFAVQLLQVLQNYIERITLVSDETVGRQSSIAKSRATKGGTLAIIGEGNIGFELINKNFLNGIKEMYIQRFQLYQQLMPDNLQIAVLEGEEWTPKTVSRDNIIGQYHFEIEADAVSGNRLMRFDLSLMLFQVLGQYLTTIYPAGMVELGRKVLRDSGDKDLEKILPKEIVEVVKEGQAIAAKLQQLRDQVDMATKMADASLKEVLAESEQEKQMLEIFKKGAEGLKLMDELMTPAGVE